MFQEWINEYNEIINKGENMEEDIKVLEEFIDAVGEEYEVVREKQALEKLIKGYRELEENEIWSTATIKGLKKDFIPKSKIKEKIDELKEQYEDYQNKWEKAGMDKSHPYYKYLIRIEAEIDILQELLEEK